MSQQNKTQLQSTINTNIADNTVGDITAQDVRDSLINITDSLLFNSGSQTFDGTLTATAFVGDGSGITGVTGEWDGSLNGNAEITGSLTVTGDLLPNRIAKNGTLEVVGNFLTLNSSTTTQISGPSGISIIGDPSIDGNVAIEGNTLMTGSLIVSGSLAVTGSNVDFVTTSGTLIPTFTLKSTDGNPGLTIDSQTSSQQIDIHTPNDLFLQGYKGGGTTSTIKLGWLTSYFTSPSIDITATTNLDVISPIITIGTDSSSTTTMNGIFTTEEYIVSSLPASPARGSRAHVTDATATTFYSIVAGGGSNVVPVFYNGTNWVIA